MTIIPTLLTTTITEFKEQLELFQKPFPRIQLDIADGKWVPNVTTQTEDIIDLIKHNDVHVEEDTVFDFHLMVEDYATELHKIEEFINLGMKVNTILINAKHNPDIAKLTAKYPQLTIGLDINPETSAQFVAQQYNLNTLKAIQIMSVNPGFQGSPFLPEVLEKIEYFKMHDYRGYIFMDGGINGTTIPTIMAKQHRPDYLCIGSYLTKAGNDLDSRIASLKSLK